ncbi:leucine-rich repeat domain-containing protein [Spirochaeta africana]|nr:leucine-rich repeat domain-containing protein [Spirochaeta africana]
MKKTLLFAAVLSLGAALIAPALEHTPVAVPDARLRAAIIAELELPETTELTREQLAELTSLRARSAGIRDLTGMEHAVNLAELDLRDNDIRSIEPLRDLAGLVWLSLRENPRLRDIGPLAGLTALEYLNLNRNYRIASIEPLAGMQQLDTLILRSVPVLHRTADQDVLRSLRGISRLNIRDTGLDTVEPLLPGLERGDYREQLDLLENPLQDRHKLTPYRAHIEDFQQYTPVFTARLRTNAGMIFGRDEWYSFAVHREPIYDLDLRLRLDVEPRSYLRIFGALDIELDTDELDFDWEIDELFLQYTFPDDTTRIRAGRQKMAWETARLLNNPADFVAAVEDGYALRLDARLPALLDVSQHATAVVYATEDYLWSDADRIELRDFAYALRYRVQPGPFDLRLSARYRQEQYRPLRTAASLGFRHDGIELRGEATTWWDRDEAPREGDGFLTAQASWTAQQPDSWRILTEYQYDSTILDGKGHYTAAEFRFPPLFGFQSQLRHRHAFQDHSGEIIPELRRTLIPGVQAVFQLPMVYGDQYGYYRRNPELGDGRAMAAILSLEAEFEF